MFNKMGIIRASWNWLKFAWERQPVLFVSSVMAIVGEPRVQGGSIEFTKFTMPVLH